MPRDYRFAKEADDEVDEDALDREPDDEAVEGGDDDDAVIALAKQTTLATLAGLEALEAGNRDEARKLLRTAERLQARLRKVNERFADAG